MTKTMPPSFPLPSAWHFDSLIRYKLWLTLPVSQGTDRVYVCSNSWFQCELTLHHCLQHEIIRKPFYTWPTIFQKAVRKNLTPWRSPICKVYLKINQPGPKVPIYAHILIPIGNLTASGH